MKEQPWHALRGKSAEQVLKYFQQFHPPVDVHDLMRRVGIILVEDGPEWRAQTTEIRPEDGAAIIWMPPESEENGRWRLANQFGALLRADPVKFALDLLIPSWMFSPLWTKGWTREHLQGLFRVPDHAVEVRIRAATHGCNGLGWMSSSELGFGRSAGEPCPRCKQDRP